MSLSTDQRLAMLKEISAAYRDLNQQIDQISDAAMERPATIGQWSGKDLLAHLADWEGVLRDQIVARDAGEPADWPTANRSVDMVNEEMLEKSRTRSLEEVKSYFREAHFALMEELERSPSVDPDHALEVTKGHYEEHHDDLARLQEK